MADQGNARAACNDSGGAAANADPNDLTFNTPPPKKVDHFKMVPVAEWERLTRAAKDHDSDDATIRTILAEFDTPQPEGELMVVQLVVRAAAALKQARADRDVLAAEVRGWRRITMGQGWIGTLPVGVMFETDASGALNRAGGGA
jgi:hypothetical protein